MRRTHRPGPSRPSRARPSAGTSAARPRPTWPLQRPPSRAVRREGRRGNFPLLRRASLLLAPRRARVARGAGAGAGAPLSRAVAPAPHPPAPPAAPVPKKKRAGVERARACVLICVARRRPRPGEQACHRRCCCARRSVASVGARSRDWIHSSVNRCTSRGQKRTPSRSAWMKLGLRELHPLVFFLVGRWGRGRSERTGRAGVRGGDRRSAASAEGDGGRGEGVRRLRGPPSLPRGESGGGEPRASALRPLRRRARARTPCARATDRRTHPRRLFSVFFFLIFCGEGLSKWREASLAGRMCAPVSPAPCGASRRHDRRSDPAAHGHFSPSLARGRARGRARPRRSKRRGARARSPADKRPWGERRGRGEHA